MKLIPLGIKGFIPTHGFHTMSFLLYTEDTLFIIDGGSGLSRIGQKKIQHIISQFDHAHIILSHFHLDHIIGLPYLVELLKIKFSLYVPSNPLVDTNGKKAIENFINKPYFSLPIYDFPNLHKIIEYSTNKIEINNNLIEFLRLKHDGGSVGIKINNEIAYITDTFVNNSYENFIKECHFVLHEIWALKCEDPLLQEQRHSYFEDVVNLLAKTNCKRLLPIHINPSWNKNKINTVFSSKIDNLKIEIPVEGKIITT